MLSVVAAVVSIVGFLGLLLLLPESGADEATPDARPFVSTLVFTSVLMMAAGALGGCLYNFRGLVKHSQDRDYDGNYDLSYQLRPLQGALSGLMVFFLLLGGALTLSVGGGTDATGWSTVPGVLP